MSQVEVERFLGRILTDANFRQKAASSLKNVCRSEGITLSPEELLLLCKSDLSKLGLVAETLDDAIKRA